MSTLLKFRFSLFDSLIIFVVAALCIGWTVDRTSIQRQRDKLERDREMLEAEKAQFEQAQYDGSIRFQERTASERSRLEGLYERFNDLIEKGKLFEQLDHSLPNT